MLNMGWTCTICGLWSYQPNIVLQTMGFDLPISLMWLDPVSLDSAIWSTNVWDDHLKTNFGA